jgi:hypothetical protein
MEIEKNMMDVSLSGEPAEGNAYRLRAENPDSEMVGSEVILPADQFFDWLMTKGCEFCAHQVKLGRAVHCDHVPLNEVELAGLGLNSSEARDQEPHVL